MTSQDGRVYRLNKQTGHIVILEGDKIVPLEVQKRPKPIDAGHEEEKVPSENPSQPVPDEPSPIVEQPAQSETPVTVDWGFKQLSGKNLKVSFKSYWKDSKLFFELEAYPYSSLKKMLDKKESDVYYQRKWHGFIVQLLDDNREIVKIIPVKLWDMTRTFDEKGKFASVKMISDIGLLEDEIIRVTDFSIDWKLDRILIPDYRFENKVDDLIDTYSWYGEVDPAQDKDAPPGAKYWWITFPDREKIYFSTEEELLESYQSTIENILEKNN